MNSWKIRNYFRLDFIFNRISAWIAQQLSGLTGVAVYTGELYAKVFKKDGTIVDLGHVSSGVVTTAFVNLMVDQLQTETSVWGDFKYHDSGVGTTAAAVGDTDIETTDGESRVAGTQTEGASANIYQSVGTIAYTTTKAITEHGLFNASTGVTLMDRHVFAAVNVVNGESIAFTYELTCTAGG
jgi:hypothetical protein